MQKLRPFWIPEVRDFIGLIVISAMVGMLFILLLRPVTVPDNQMTNILIGGFMTATTAVIQFYFGSSKSSAAKDDTINTLTTAATETSQPSANGDAARAAPLPPRPQPTTLTPRTQP
jgi:hypothetical protein